MTVCGGAIVPLFASMNRWDQAGIKRASSGKEAEKKKADKLRCRLFSVMLVGVQGFEPWTPWSQTRCATGLRYTPKKQDNIGLRPGGQGFAEKLYGSAWLKRFWIET